MLKLIFIFLLFILHLHAKGGSDANSYADYIDEKHKVISKKVLDWSVELDDKASTWLSSVDSKVDTIKQDVSNINSMDAFFQNDKFITETKLTFVKLHINSLLQSKDSTTYDIKINAQVPLSKTKQRFKLFIDNIKNNYTDSPTNNNENNNKLEIGVNYFAPSYYGIVSKYSLGISGIYPFVRARYSKIFQTGSWYIEPTQQFEYSLKDRYEEETNIYFSKPLSRFSLFRTTLHRKTQYDVDGMDYSVDFSYFHTPSLTTGFSISQRFIGNTRYRYITDTTTNPYTLSDEFSGIHDYLTIFNWRQSIWRKWLVYELIPGVSFHRQYDYKPNYLFRFSLNFYFGDEI